MGNDLVRCSKLNVDCVENDPVDIKCGGPKYLGFDFYVKEEEIEEMKEFISLVLINYEIPLINIYVSEMVELEKNKVWDKIRIIDVIEKDAAYLKKESIRNYRSLNRK